MNFKSQLREHRIALALLIVFLAGYLISMSFGQGQVDWPTVAQHTLLTMMVVMIVHILDHMYLSRGALRMVRKEFRPVSDAAKESLDRLAAASRSLEAMRNSGITRVYSSRFQASMDIAREISPANVEQIRLIGISLNDFILDNAQTLNQAYQMIVQRLHRIASGAGGDDALDVKVLIIDPYSYGAQQRHLAEQEGEHAPPGRLLHDVQTAAERLLKLKADLQMKAGTAGPRGKVAFDCRLYRVAPQLFLAWTEQACYVEQYYFWFSRDAQSTVPVLRFAPPDEQESPTKSLGEPERRKDIHCEMKRHFEWVWDHASVPIEAFVREPVIGCDMGVCQAAAVNLFMDEDRCSERIVRLLQSVGPKSKVDLMGISLRSFFDEPNPIAQAFRKSILEQDGPEVRILYIDPECPLARVRSYAEALLTNDAVDFDAYNRDQSSHGDSAIRRAVGYTRRRLQTLAKAGRPTLESREYECAHACFMLRVDDVVLFEPYTHGKLDCSKPQRTIGGDMPVFEFHCQTPAYLKLFKEVPNRNPWGLLKDHFDFVWKISEARNRAGIPRQGGAAQALATPSDRPLETSGQVQGVGI